MSEGRKRFSRRTFAIALALLCLGLGILAAFSDVAIALIYFVLYPLAIFIMVSLIVGVLVLGRFLIEKMRP